MRLIVAATCCIGLFCAGCGDDDAASGGAADRASVEALVKKASPERPVDSVSCVELATDRHYRCEVQVGAIGSVYEAIVSKDGKAVQLIAK